MRKLLSLLLVLSITFGIAACGVSTAPVAAPAAPAAEPATEPAQTPEPAPVPPLEPIPGASSDPKVTLTYAEVYSEDSLMGMAAAEFKKKTEELTGGSVTINLQYGGPLDTESKVIEEMLDAGGTADIARVSAFGLIGYGAERASLLSIPYAFAGREHFRKYAESDLAAEILMEPHDIGLGVRGLFYLEDGFRHFFFRASVSGITDLDGKKIRVSADPVMTGLVEGLKASPAVVAQTELYQSLSSGVVDGAEQTIANYQGYSFNEVAPYVILDGHTLAASQVIISDAAWDKLTERQREAIVEAGRQTGVFCAAESANIENVRIEELKAAGVTFVPVADIKTWQEACSVVVTSSTEGHEGDYNKILSMKE